MAVLKEVAGEIFDICYDVEKNITGLSEAEASSWAKANSIRHAHTINTIMDYAVRNKINDLDILNASGISCGHQDFSIKSYFDKKSLKVKWKVFESPNSIFIKNKTFKNYLEKLEIELEISDFAKTDPGDLYGEAEKEFDVIIFTEIAEHLDYTTFLNSLLAVRRKLKNNGILIFTSPNLVSLPNRMRILFGNGILTYMGDGTLNLEKGIYGHIVYYDIKRLTRIFKDIGLKVDTAYTFNYGEGAHSGSRGAMIALNNFITYFFKNMRSTVFLLASKTEPEKIEMILPSQV